MRTSGKRKGESRLAEKESTTSPHKDEGSGESLSAKAVAEENRRTKTGEIEKSRNQEEMKGSSENLAFTFFE